ncbi:MAG: zinc metalloprotease [Planctomycetota bacterium]
MKFVRLVFASCLLLAPFAAAQSGGRAAEQEPVIVVDGVPFYSWQAYTSSQLFRDKELRCTSRFSEEIPFAPPSDCAYGSTVIKPEYDPGATIEIPVVVHVIQSTSGQGNIPDFRIESQIDILNEDFLALMGTNGQNGTDTQIRFYLANVDPNGNPTNGITRTTNNSWFNDSGTYFNTLAWDTNRYLNIYTNQASGALGYVPDLPQGGLVGSKSDRVVCLWSAFGRNAPIGAPYNQGRTVTHEVGHYLGLWHTFDRGCGTSSCYSTGDAICDTNRESGPVFGCPGSSTSCGSSDPFHNYMDYSDDLCMEEFTPEQTNRMRCTLEFWRPNLACAEAISTSRAGGGNNFDTAYTVSADPLLGTSFTASVDATASGYSSVTLLGYLGQGNFPLSGGQVLLLDLGSPFLFSTTLPGPVANFNVTIPNSTNFCGLRISSQGVLFGGLASFRLTNSQDWTIGL